MKLSIANIDKIIKANPTMVGQVTNPVMMDRGHTPTMDGLLSTDIFGNTAKDRSRKFGYVDLGGYYFHPIVYKNIKRLDRRIDGIINGTIKVTIDGKGRLVEDEKGHTGIEFLYKNWEKIKFAKNESAIRNERVDLLSHHSRAESFTQYWLISPAMYRDINLQNADTGKISYHEINTLYARLIRLASMLRSDSSFTAIMHNTRFMIQSTLVEIYDYYKNLVEKKNGVIRKSLLGKSVDYGARVVISTPLFNTNSYKDTEVDFFHAGIPLSLCCSLFTPFIVGWIRGFFEREFEYTGDKYPIQSKKDKTQVEYVQLKDPLGYYNESKIEKMIDTFVFSYSGRFNKILLPTEDMEKKPMYMAWTGTLGIPTDDIEPILRPMTLTDLMFMAAYDVCKDKHVYITRYPITHYLGVFPIGISVLSTHKTMKLTTKGVTYERYPVVDPDLPKSQVATSFADTVRFQNIYLSCLGGDYDGDQISVKGVFSQSANEEARKILHSKINIIGLGGNGLRTTTNETVQTLYSMTKFNEA